MSADPTHTPTTANGAPDPDAEVRLADGRLMPAKDAPIGGQAVLEGVMMRGVSTWAVAVRMPGCPRRASTDHEHRLTEEARSSPNGADGRADRRGQRRRAATEERARARSRSTREPFESAMKKRRLYPPADDPRRRRPLRVAEDRHAGARHLRQRAARGARRGDLRQDLGLHDLPLARVCGRTLLRAAGTVANFWKDELGSSVAVRRGREADPHLDLPRLPVGDLPHQGPAARVRVPRRRAQGDLVLRGRRAAHARERAEVLAPARALRDELPADRDDHRRVRVRPDRASRPALADPVSHRGHRARRGPRLRGDPLGRAQPAQAAGCAA